MINIWIGIWLITTIFVSFLSKDANKLRKISTSSILGIGLSLIYVMTYSSLTPCQGFCGLTPVLHFIAMSIIVIMSLILWALSNKGVSV